MDYLNIGRLGKFTQFSNIESWSLNIYLCFSPTWVQDIVDLLEKVYNNAIYAKVHPTPEDGIIQLEDSIKVCIIAVYIEGFLN